MVNMMMIMTFPLPFPWLVIKSWLRSKRLNRKSNRLSDPHLDKMVSTWLIFFSYSWSIRIYAGLDVIDVPPISIFKVYSQQFQRREYLSLSQSLLNCCKRPQPNCEMTIE